MISFWSLCVFLIFHRVSSVAVPLNLTAGGDGDLISIPLVNATELRVDPRFSIHFKVGKYSINGVSAYMNTIGLLANQALLNFNGELNLPASASVPNWSNVRVTASPIKAGATITRRFVVWGLYQALWQFTKQRFTSGTFFLEWKGQTVGLILYNPNPMPTQDPDLLSPSDESQSVIPSAPNADVEIETSYLTNAKTLTFQATYLPLAAVLHLLAPHPSTDTVDTFVSKNGDYGSMISVIRAETGPLATAENFIAGVWRLAQFITLGRRYAEAQSELTLAGRDVGKVVLQAMPRVAAPPDIDTA